MAISGWNDRYEEILKEFGYNKKEDKAAAIRLGGILKKSDAIKKIKTLINKKTVLVVGSGPSLLDAIPNLKNCKRHTTVIAADSAVKPLVDNGVIPDIVVTDLDGDRDTLEKIAMTESIFVVHAHGDNMQKLDFAKEIKNWIGTTQTEPINGIQNYGGFTDGDRAVFLASHFQAKKIVLFGMDFGKRIGRFSNTKRSERTVKQQKLRAGEELLKWLATLTSSELYTTSRPIVGFKKISYMDLDNTIT